jgi:hypothetical protein
MFLEHIGHNTQSRSGTLFRSARGASGLGLVLLLSLPVSAGSLGIGADIGGISADIGIGHGGVSASVGIGGSGGSGGSTHGVSADVGIGGGGVSAGVDIGGSGGGGTTPGDVVPDGLAPGNGDVVASTSGAVAPAVVPKGRMACAKDGNVSAFNGFVVRDRNGGAIGWVNDATISNDRKITTVRIQSTGKTCYLLTGGNFTVRNGELWANVNAASFK